MRVDSMENGILCEEKQNTQKRLGYQYIYQTKDI